MSSREPCTSDSGYCARNNACCHHIQSPGTSRKKICWWCNISRIRLLCPKVASWRDALVEVKRNTSRTTSAGKLGGYLQEVLSARCIHNQGGRHTSKVVHQLRPDSGCLCTWRQSYIRCYRFKTSSGTRRRWETGIHRSCICCKVMERSCPCRLYIVARHNALVRPQIHHITKIYWRRDS